MITDVMSGSRMDTFLRCRRQYFYKYELHLQPEVSSLALRYGSAIHELIAGKKIDEVAEGKQFEEMDLAILSALFNGYCDKWGSAMPIGFHPEVQINSKIEGCRKFSFTSILDTIGTLPDGRVCLVEHKTTGESLEDGGAYWAGAAQNTQLCGQVLSAREHGWDVETIVYDVIRKPSIRPKQVKGLDRVENAEEYGKRLVQDIAERPDFYYSRKEIPVLSDELEEFKATRLSVCWEIMAARKMAGKCAQRCHAFPRTSCRRMVCNTCECAAFCLAGIDVEQTLPSGFRRDA